MSDEFEDVPQGRRELALRIAALAWDKGVDAAYRGAVTRQNAEDVRRSNPYRAEADAFRGGALHPCEGCGVELDGDDSSARCEDCECDVNADEAYDRLHGVDGHAQAVTPRYISGGPDLADVAALRELLDLLENFSDNDQRARYLLSSNWMRDKIERYA